MESYDLYSISGTSPRISHLCQMKTRQMCKDDWEKRSKSKITNPKFNHAKDNLSNWKFETKTKQMKPILIAWWLALHCPLPVETFAISREKNSDCIKIWSSSKLNYQLSFWKKKLDLCVSSCIMKAPNDKVYLSQKLIKPFFILSRAIEDVI